MNQLVGLFLQISWDDLLAPQSNFLHRSEVMVMKPGPGPLVRKTLSGVPGRRDCFLWDQ